MKFADKDLKAAIINMLKDLKDNMNIMKKKKWRKKEPSGNYRDEKYDSWNKKFTWWIVLMKKIKIL